MKAPSPHATRIYGAEYMALHRLPIRILDRATVTELAGRIVGQKVKVVDLPDWCDGSVDGGACWSERKPLLAFRDNTAVPDVLLAHEVAHLKADAEEYRCGHGIEWVRTYVAALREFHRHDAADAIMHWVAPIAVVQPEYERGAA